MDVIQTDESTSEPKKANGNVLVTSLARVCSNSSVSVEARTHSRVWQSWRVLRSNKQNSTFAVVLQLQWLTSIRNHGLTWDGTAAFGMDPHQSHRLWIGRWFINRMYLQLSSQYSTYNNNCKSLGSISSQFRSQQMGESESESRSSWWNRSNYMYVHRNPDIRSVD